MRTLIVYATKHGCTEKCANKLKNKLTGDTELLNLKNTVKTELNDYQRIIKSVSKISEASITRFANQMN